jgi:hypothetical protein
MLVGFNPETASVEFRYWEQVWLMSSEVLRQHHWFG